MKLLRRTNRNINLSQGDIKTGIILFTIPLLLSNLLQQLYNTADLIIVGTFAGKNPMAAVGVTGPIVQLLLGLFLGIATGASVIVAQTFGADNREELKKAVHTSYAIAIISGIALSIVGYILSPMLLRLIRTPDEIMAESVAYLRISFIGSVPLLIYNMGAGILRSVGDSQRPFNFLVVAAITNVVLDLVFVAMFKMSVVGAGIATLIAQIVSAVLVTYNLLKSDRTFKLELREIKLHSDSLKSILKIGLPAGMQGVIISISNTLIQSEINGFGSSIIAGNAACSRIDGFIFTAIQAIALSATTYSGQNFGAGNTHRIKEGFKFSMFLAIVTGGFLGGLSMVFSKPLIGIFNPDISVIEAGAEILMIMGPFYVVFGMSEILAGFVTGKGNSVPPMVISLVFMCLFRVVYIFIAMGLYPDPKTIYWAYPFSWTLTFIANALYFKFGKWREN